MKNDLFELHDKFCQEALLKNYRPSTIEWWRTSIRMFHGHFDQGTIRHCSDITLERLRSYFVDKRSSGWSAHTYSNQYRSLKSFLDWCVRGDVIHVNPLDAIERPKLEKKLPKCITAEEAKLVLNYAFYGPVRHRFQRYRDRAILAVMVYAGLRSAETLNLQLSHVDLAQRSLVVRCGKGAKDRLVPISSTLALCLGDYLDERVRAKKQHPSLFTFTTEDRPLNRGGLKKMVTRVRKATGVDFSAHRLRHTFATLMLEGGCDLFSLKEMMGHSRIETTLGYLSATLNHLRGEIAKHPLG